jgi:hypothetical protein
MPARLTVTRSCSLRIGSSLVEFSAPTAFKFAISTPGRVYYCAAESEDSLHEWCTAIQAVLDKA